MLFTFTVITTIGLWSCISLTITLIFRLRQCGTSDNIRSNVLHSLRSHWHSTHYDGHRKRWQISCWTGQTWSTWSLFLIFLSLMNFDRGNHCSEEGEVIIIITMRKMINWLKLLHRHLYPMSFHVSYFKVELILNISVTANGRAKRSSIDKPKLNNKNELDLECEFS